MIPQLCEYIKHNELYTFNEWIVCYGNYISIKLLKILRENCFQTTNQGWGQQKMHFQAYKESKILPPELHFQKACTTKINRKTEEPGI